MIPRNIRQTELSFFFFASFGAASMLALLITSLLSFLLSAFGTGIAFSAALWIFLFLFPTTLTLSSSFIATKLGGIEMPSIVYSVIVGYGAYSLISLFILLVGGRNEPALWILLILALISVALFNAEAILARFGIREDIRPTEASGTRALHIPQSTLPIKISSQPGESSHEKRPIFSIRNDWKKSENEESKDINMQSSAGGVIHLGPRS